MSNAEEDYWNGYPKHVQVKHTILAHYLKIWVQHLGKNPEICYFGCFAGRGRHGTGDEGSPIKALKVIEEVKASTNLDNAYCIFIERDFEEFQRLEIELSQSRGEYPFPQVECVNKSFDDCIEPLMAKYNVPGRPAFFFIDPFGYAGIRMHLVQEILSYRRTEVLFTFMISAIQRWLGLPDQQANFVSLFGTQDLMCILDEKEHLEARLVDFYEHQLRKAAGDRFVLRFKMCDDEQHRTLYYLIHATNNLTGCRKMKDVMGRNASQEGSPFAYLGPDDVFCRASSFLFAEAEISAFAERLLAQFAGRTLSFEELVRESIMDNYFLEGTYKKVLRQLVEGHQVEPIGLGPRGGIRDVSRFGFPELG